MLASSSVEQAVHPVANWGLCCTASDFDAQRLQPLLKLCELSKAVVRHVASMYAMQRPGVCPSSTWGVQAHKLTKLAYVIYCADPSKWTEVVVYQNSSPCADLVRI